MTLTDGQYEPLGNDVPSLLPTIMSIAAPYLAFVSPGTAALVGGAAVVMEFFGRQQLEARLSELKNAIEEAFLSSIPSDAEFAAKLENPAARETLTRAVLQTLWTPQLEKVHRFGTLVGTELTSDAPNWNEAAEFIRDLEGISDADLELIELLWRVQHPAFRMGTANGRGMSTNANEYTQTWTEIIGLAAQKGISRDDLYSRCGGLTGFGLAQQVQSNGSFQGPDDQCYRLTGRAVRLMTLLGLRIPSNGPTACGWTRTDAS